MATHEDVLIALRRIVRATDRYSRLLSKEAGLTAPQLLVMQAIVRHDELTMGQVADAVSLSQATVTTILDRLEKRGLVERKRSEQDKRRVRSEEHTSELQSRGHLVCRLLLEKKN